MPEKILTLLVTVEQADVATRHDEQLLYLCKRHEHE